MEGKKKKKNNAKVSGHYICPRTNTDAGGGQVHMRGARTLWDGREGDENAGINILE